MMSNQEILDKLHVRKGEATAKKDFLSVAQIDNVCDMLSLLPEGVDFAKEFPTLERYANTSEESEKSEVSSTEKESILTTIIDLVRAFLKKNRAEVVAETEQTVLKSMNKHTKNLLVGFLVGIGIIAVAAVVFTVLNLVYGEEFLNGWGGKIASALGTLDFALGALGFILERIDDMKKREVQSAVKVAGEKGDFKALHGIVITNCPGSAFGKNSTVNNIGQVIISDSADSKIRDDLADI